MAFTPLPERGIVAVSGEDRIAFLQGLVSNDVTQASGEEAVWAALLTPQGKWLADFFVFAEGERLLLDVERGQAAMIVQRLSRFRLRSRVALAEEPERWVVHAAWGAPPPGAARVLADPRHPEAGWRAYASAALAADATPEDYARHRLALGLPDGSADCEAEKTVLLEAGFDELHGIAWDKGCYMGQELTARTRYRGLVKRRLVPVTFDGPPPPRGTPITRDGAEAGEMRSGVAGLGLALLRLDAWEGPLLAEGRPLTARPPAWLRLPQAARA